MFRRRTIGVARWCMGHRSLLRFSAVVIAAVFAISPVSAQKTGGTGGGGTGGGAGAGGGGNIPSPNPTTPTRPTTPTTPSPGQQSPFPTDMRRPIFLSGKVLVSDGSLPPDPVTIERVCQGYVRPEGYTDS